jgi:hypothetical protein
MVERMCAGEFLEAYEAQNRSVLSVYKDPSTGATQKLPEERRFERTLIFAGKPGFRKCFASKNTENRE